MSRTVIVLLAAGLLLSSCGGWSNSRLNPGNWFGRSRSVPVEAQAGDVNPLIPRRSITARPEAPDTHVPIQSVSELHVERTSSGAIIRATGLAATQGAYEPRLRPVPLDEENKGLFELVFEVVYPINPRPVGPERTRQIIAAYSVSNQDLQSIRTIRVTAASNARETRRR